MVIYIVSLLRPKIKVTDLRLTRPSILCVCAYHTLKPQIGI